MKFTIDQQHKRPLVLLLVFWFVWSEGANIGDFFAGFYDGAGGLPSEAQ